MHLANGLVFRRQALPSIGDGKSIIDRHGLSVELDPTWILESDGGNLPTRYRGEPTGFECALSEVNDDERADLPDGVEPELTVAFAARGDPSFGAALIAAACFAELVGGTVAPRRPESCSHPAGSADRVRAVSPASAVRDAALISRESGMRSIVAMDVVLLALAAGGLACSQPSAHASSSGTQGTSSATSSSAVGSSGARTSAMSSSGTASTTATASSSTGGSTSTSSGSTSTSSGSTSASSGAASSGASTSGSALLANCLGMGNTVYLSTADDGGNYLFDGTATGLFGTLYVVNGSASEQSEIELDYSGNIGSSIGSVQLTFESAGGPLTVGSYLDAGRFSPGEPTLDLGVDSRGCDTLNGAFDIAALSYAPDGGLAQFLATFQTDNCGVPTPPLVGCVVYSNTNPAPFCPPDAGPEPIVGPDPGPLDPCSDAGNLFFVQGPTGAFFSGSATVTGPTAQFSAQFYGSLIELSIEDTRQPGDFYSLSFDSSGIGQPLQLGLYTNATRAGIGVPCTVGLDFSSGGAGCDQETGSFSIDALSVDDGGNLTALQATFAQTSCYGEPSTGTVTGCVNYRVLPDGG